MYNDKLVYKVVIWAFSCVSFLNEKDALILDLLFYIRVIAHVLI